MHDKQVPPAPTPAPRKQPPPIIDVIKVPGPMGTWTWHPIVRRVDPDA